MNSTRSPRKITSRSIGLIVGFILAGFGLWALIDVGSHLRSGELATALSSIPTYKLALAALATILSFGTLALMEWLAARHYLQNTFRFGPASYFALMIYGISNTFGFAGLASTPLRLRLYSAIGTSDSTSEAAHNDRILSLCLLATTAFWIGLFFLLGVSLIGAAAFASRVLPISIAREGLMALGIALVLASIGACYFLADRGTRRFGGFDLRFPGSRQLLLQTGLAALDWLLAGIALYVLLPDITSIHFLRFLSGFLLSQIAALVSSIPGGIGVLEGFSLYLMDAPKNQVPQIAAAFIAYRSIYYIPPLLIAFALFIVWNAKRARSTLSHAGGALITYGRSITPMLAAGLSVLIGFGLLLTSGQAFALVSHWSTLPPFWESLSGTALLIFAIGLYERSSSARLATLVTMSMLFMSALLAGPVWSAAFMTLALGLLLLFNKREFYRRSELSDLRSRLHLHFSAVVVLPTLASMVLAIVAFYRNELDSRQWWQITFDSQASGFLRGCVGSLVAMGGFAIWSLLSPRRTPAVVKQDNEKRADYSAIQKSPYTTACLALIGDKSLFHTPSIDGFIMYKVARPYWVAMGDPVCDPIDAKALIAAFIEECDRLGAVPVFYQTRPETLARYVEIGFQAVKIGEEARVRLPDFSLEGRERKTMRNTCSRIEREGFTFTLLSRESVRSRLPELRQVSDEWLEKLSMREKGFSIGFFNDDYIAGNDVAVVMKGDRIVAFANLWITGSKEEFSVDLMRYSNAAPSGAIEYLIIQLMLHARSEGHLWFNLGMAPLAGLEGIHSGRQWHRVGSMIYRAGEAFYNFRGLKAFKDKFGPAWEPRFLVYPPGSNLAVLLSSVALLINFRSRREAAQRQAS